MAKLSFRKMLSASFMGALLAAGSSFVLANAGGILGSLVTFGAVTAFGTGDPSSMAGGVSGSLLSTLLSIFYSPSVILIAWLLGAVFIFIMQESLNWMTAKAFAVAGMVLMATLFLPHLYLIQSVGVLFAVLWLLVVLGGGIFWGRLTERAVAKGWQK